MGSGQVWLFGKDEPLPYFAVWIDPLAVLFLFNLKKKVKLLSKKSECGRDLGGKKELAPGEGETYLRAGVLAVRRGAPLLLGKRKPANKMDSEIKAFV